MQREIEELPRCYVCNAPLGESNNSLYVEDKWVHYTCAFHQSVKKIKENKNNTEHNGMKENNNA